MTLPFDMRHLKNKVYYSQNREDLILEAFFPELKDGFYVDIGGYDPDYDSVTKLFYKKGWNGITVEPQPKNFARFEKVRKRDINIHCGVSDRPGKMVLRSYENGGLSTFSPEMMKHYSGHVDDDTRNYHDISVPVRTLEDIFNDNEVTTIHFMKVDVEGLEYEVLSSNDWEKFRPMVLCIEANHMVKDWHQLLKKNGYKSVYSDGLNEYFVDTKANDINFNYVDHVITRRGGGLAYADYRDIKNSIARLDKTLATKQSSIDELNQLNKFLGFRISELEREMMSRKVLLRKFMRLSIDRMKVGRK